MPPGYRKTRTIVLSRPVNVAKLVFTGEYNPVVYSKFSANRPVGAVIEV